MKTLRANLHKHVIKTGTRVVHHIRQHHKKYIAGIVGGALVAKLIVFLVTSFSIYNGNNTYADTETGYNLSGYQYSGGIIIDLKQESIVFDVIVGADLSISYISNAAKIIGIDTGLSVSIQNGFYNINGGDWNTGNSLILSGDILQLKFVSSDLPSTAITGSLFIGDYESVFSVRTKTQSEIGTGESNNSGDSQQVQILQTINVSNSTDEGLFVSTGANNSGNNNTGAINTGSNSTDNSGIVSTVNTGIINTGSNGTVNSGIVSTVNTGIINSGSNNTTNNSNTNYGFTGVANSGANIIPYITGVVVSSSGGNLSGYLSIGARVNVKFKSNKTLTGINITVGNLAAKLVSKSGNNYSYYIITASGLTQGKLSYIIKYKDLNSHSGQYLNISNLIFDSKGPVINNIFYTGSYNKTIITFDLSEKAKSNFSGWNAYTGGVITGGLRFKFSKTSYLTQHIYILTGLSATGLYSFNFDAVDYVPNRVFGSGMFYFDQSGKVQLYNSLVLDKSVVQRNLNEASVATLMGQEIMKFNSCREKIKYGAINLKINNIDLSINIPLFRTEYLKKMTNIFSLLVFNKLESENSIGTQGLKDILKRYENFLIVLKLIKDDELECKQNLSNYHITRLQTILEEYGIFVSN